MSSSGADVTRLHADTHHHADTRHMSTSRPLLTRSRSDMSRDSLRSTLDGMTVDNSHLPSTTSQHHHHHHPHPRPHHDAAAVSLLLQFLISRHRSCERHSLVNVWFSCSFSQTEMYHLNSSCSLLCLLYLCRSTSYLYSHNAILTHALLNGVLSNDLE